MLCVLWRELTIKPIRENEQKTGDDMSVKGKDRRREKEDKVYDPDRNVGWV